MTGGAGGLQQVNHVCCEWAVFALSPVFDRSAIPYVRYGEVERVKDWDFECKQSYPRNPGRTISSFLIRAISIEQKFTLA